MHYEDFSLDDFLNDQMFLQWVKQPDQELHAFWETWQEKNPEKRQLVDEAREVVRYLNFQVAQPTYKDFLEVKQHIKSQLWEESLLNTTDEGIDEIQEAPEPDVPSYSFTHYYQYIAVFVGLLVISTVFFLLLKDGKKIYQTAFGQTRTVLLPDGSKVTMNANSTLQYMGEWNTSRPIEVWIKGEAFFELRKQPGADSGKASSPFRKFIVHTSNVDLEATGAAFNVKSRRGKVKIMLVSGKLKLEIPSKKMADFYMNPGQLVEVSQHGKNIQTSQADPVAYCSWRHRKLIFSNTPLAEITQLIEDTYGVKVELQSDSLGLRKLSGSVSGNQLHTLLGIIAASSHIHVKHEKDKITLASK
jgi:ferric-dicitrate binding protein FerR (iron transport regulator)